MKSKLISLKMTLRQKTEELNIYLKAGLMWGNDSKEMLREIQDLLDRVMDEAVEKSKYVLNGIPVSKAVWVKAERLAGFINKTGEPDEPATRCWGAGDLLGMINEEVGQ